MDIHGMPALARRTWRLHPAPLRALKGGDTRRSSHGQNLHWYLTAHVSGRRDSLRYGMGVMG